MAEEEHSPGVVLHFKSSKELKPTGSKHIRRVEVVLEATVNNDAAWALVQARIQEGIKVFASEDFRTELNNALAGENATLERRLKLAEEQARGLRAEHAVTLTENALMREALSVLQRDIEGG